MSILAIDNLNHFFGIDQIFDNISLEINSSEKVGIVGVNGVGKTTLLKIISKELIPESGEIYVQKNTIISYLKQDENFDSNLSLYDSVINSFVNFIDLENKISHIQQLIENEKNSNSLDSLSKRYSLLEDEYKMLGGYEYKSRVKGILKGLGFDEESFEMKISSLSGGQKTRLALARILSQEPDILLLDEPTNHLDINSIMWFEDFIKNYSKTVLMVSHDRYFLDKTTNKIIELENKKANEFKGNYSNYIVQKKELIKVQEGHYNNQQKEIKRLEGIIDQQKRWNRERNIKKADSFQKKLDKIDLKQAPEKQSESVNIKMDIEVQSGKDVLTINGLSKAFGENKLFENFNCEVKRGDRIAVLGSNGCGKSTLLKIISDKFKPDSGTCRFGVNVKMGYFDQEHNDLDFSKEIYSDVEGCNADLNMTQVRTVLGAFLFRGDDVFKKISNLSGGEKSRVSFVKMILNMPNLILLDEPTNHLDINTKDVLENVLDSYEGTILFVSHDRYFVNRIANRIIDFTNEGIHIYNGNYSDYIRYQKNNINVEVKILKDSKNDSYLKVDYQKQKGEKAKTKKLEKDIKNTEVQIAKIENDLQVIEQNMVDPKIVSDHSKLEGLFQLKEELSSELEALYEKWDELDSINN